MSAPSETTAGIFSSTPGFASDPNATSIEEIQRSQLEDKLEQLLQSLLEVGICTSDVQDNAREGGRTGRGEPLGPGGLIGKKINESIVHMAELYELNSSVSLEIPIPIEVINYIDQGTNPDRWLKSFVERAAHENMYTNGILHNINHYQNLLRTQLAQHFPELYAQLCQLTSVRSDPTPRPADSDRPSDRLPSDQQ